MGKAPFTPDRVKAVFFDINETLLDPSRTLRHAFQHVWEDISGRLDTGGEQPKPDKIWEAYQGEWRAGRPAGDRRESSAEAMQRKMAAMASAVQAWELKLSDSALRSFFHRVHEYQEKAPQLYPGTAEALAKLSRSYKIAIISNGFQDKQTRRLRAAGQIPPLREDRMFFSQAVGVRKPHPNIFRHAMEVMGVRPDQAVMIGNSWSKDVMGAVKVHMNAVWFHPRETQKHFRRKAGSARIHVVSSMEQLVTLFET